MYELVLKMTYIRKAHGVILVVSCAEPGVGLNPDVFLPT